MQAALSAQINKSDRNDARGIAQMMRVGLYRPVHVKTMASQKRRMLLTSRQLLQAKALDIENDLRGTLRNFSGLHCYLRVGPRNPRPFRATSARPHIRQLDESSLATHGRTIHWGQIRPSRDVCGTSVT